MKFHATVQLDGKTATGIEVPAEIVEELSGGKRPAVTVTIGSYCYSSTIGSMRGVAKIPISAEHRKGAGVSAGDEVDVEVVLDTAPREVTAPADLVAALAPDAEASRFYEGLSVTNRKAYGLWIESAKKAETRERRVVEAVTMLREGRVRR